MAGSFCPCSGRLHAGQNLASMASGPRNPKQTVTINLGKRTFNRIKCILSFTVHYLLSVKSFHWFELTV